MIENIVRYVFKMVAEGKTRALQKTLESDPEWVQMRKDDGEFEAKATQTVAHSEGLNAEVTEFLTATREELQAIKAGTHPIQTSQGNEAVRVPPHYPPRKKWVTREQ
jgi:hypothetical protein